MSGEDITGKKEYKRNQQDRESISESCDGNLPVYDDSGEYVSGGLNKGGFYGLGSGVR